MATITLGNTKSTQALESNGISLELEMYDQTSDTPDKKVDKIVWEKEEYDSCAVLLKVKVNGYADRDYEPGELVLKLLSNGKEVKLDGDYIHGIGGGGDDPDIEALDINDKDYWKVNLCVYDDYNCYTNWGVDNNRVYIKNAYKIKKGQKISDIIGISKVYEKSKGNGSKTLEVVVCENDTEILRSNKCNLEYKFKEFEEISYEKANDTFVRFDYFDIDAECLFYDEYNSCRFEYNVNIDKEIKNDMKLKLYYIMPKEIELEIDRFDSSFRWDGWNLEIEKEIKSNIHYNITENYNEQKDTKIEVIIDFETFKNLNFIGEVEVRFRLRYEISIDNVKKREIYKIKNYVMWEQQELYSYDNYNEYEKCYEMIRKDTEDIDGDGNYNELLLYKEGFNWHGLKREIRVATIYDVRDKINIPESETIQVKANGELIREFDITMRYDYGSFVRSCIYYIAVDIYDENDDEIEYTIEEEKKDGYLTYIEHNKSSYNDFDEDYIIYYIKENEVDQITTNVSVTKIWEDDNNKMGKRPENVVLQLKDGENVITEAIVNEENNWRYTFSGIRKYRDNGSIIEYTVDEKETSEFYEKELLGNRIINRYVDPKIKVIANKVWEDKNNKYLKRPESVILQIKNKDEIIEEAEVNELNNWTYEFEVLKYDEFGNEIEYTVDEKETSEFYEKTVDGYTIINKYKSIDEDKDDNDENNENKENIENGVVDVDTSDINIFVYILIFFVAIIGVICVIFFVRKNKK